MLTSAQKAVLFGMYRAKLSVMSSEAEGALQQGAEELHKAYDAVNTQAKRIEELLDTVRGQAEALARATKRNRELTARIDAVRAAVEARDKVVVDIETGTPGLCAQKANGRYVDLYTFPAKTCARKVLYAKIENDYGNGWYTVWGSPTQHYDPALDRSRTRVEDGKMYPATAFHWHGGPL